MKIEIGTNEQNAHTKHKEKDNFRKGYLVLVITSLFQNTPLPHLMLPIPPFLWENSEPSFLIKSQKPKPPFIYRGYVLSSNQHNQFIDEWYNIK